MHPTSDPAHESQTRTDPGADGNDDAVKVPDDGEEQIEPVQKTSVLINISFCLGVGLMLVYAGLDAHQALASAGHGWDIVSIFTIAVPRLLSGTIWVELIILCFLAVMCTGSRGARQTLMLYAAVCCLSGMLITAGSFDLAGFFFPAFTALNPATSPATASLTVTKVLVIIVGVGAALFIFLLGLVSTWDEEGVLSEEPPASAAESMENVAGADEETGMTIEERQAAHYLEMLRLIDEEERVTRTPAEQRILDLRAKMAVTENPLEKQRLEGEILLTLRAERAGLEPYDGELDGDEPVDGELVDEEETSEGAEATASTESATPKLVLPPRPKALYGVMWCFVAMMVVEAAHQIFLHVIDERSAGGVELWVGFILPGLALLLVVHAIPMLILWLLWRGRTLAYVIVVIIFIFIAIKGLIDFANTFLTTGYLSRLMSGTQTWSSRYYAAAVLSENVADTLITFLSILIVVLLIRRSTRMYVAIVSSMRLKAREQRNAGESYVVSHQNTDTETRARLEEAQAHRKHKEADRGAEEAVAQQYETTRRKAARKKPRKEQRGYKDTSVYTEEGYRLN